MTGVETCALPICKGKVDDARNLGEEIAKCSLYESEKPFIFVLDEAQRYTASAKQSLLTALDDYQKKCLYYSFNFRFS